MWPVELGLLQEGPTNITSLAHLSHPQQEAE